MTDGSAPAITHGVAAGGGTVLVTWGELRKGDDSFGPAGQRQRFEMARAFDVRTLGPLEAPRVIGSQEAIDALSNGAAPFALPAGGEVGTATCAWAAFAGKLACETAPVTLSPGGPTREAGVPRDASADAGAAMRSRWKDDVPGPGPQKDRVAAAGVDDGVLLLLPQCQEIRVYASRTPKRDTLLVAGSTDMLVDCNPKRDVDAPAIVAAGEHGAVAAWRRVGLIEVRRLHADGTADGARAQASAAGEEVGAPALAWSKGVTAIVYAARRPGAPYVLELATWSGGGGAPARAVVAASPSPAVAPAIAATDDPSCWLVSWTEGAGHATRARAGLVCGGALEATSVVDVSPPGVEAGDSELWASGPSSAYVAWQALPSGKSSEIRLAEVVCE